MSLSSENALVLFSGGQDSSVCLAWALQTFDHVETIGFDYGQRHRIELDVRSEFRDGLLSLNSDWVNKLGLDHLIDLKVLGEISQTSLTQDVEITMGEAGLPNTFVPGRNLLFLTFAAAIAYRRGIKHIVTGVCETDYSGYPDCRDDTIKAMQIALGLGMDKRFVLHTPLMWLDKAQTWEMTEHLGGENLIDLIRVRSHTCYLGQRDQLHEWGHGCANCPACDLRRQGFLKWQSRKGNLK
jgi:7-cyano-7-deazaguanine synthase